MSKLFAPLALLLLLIPVSASPGQGQTAVKAVSEVDDSLPVLGALEGENAVRDRNLTEQMSRLVEEGKEIETIELCRAQLALRQEALGRDDPLTVEAVHNLGGALTDHAGKFTEAEPLLRRALAGWERLLEPDHPRRLGAMDALGYTLKKRGKFEEAEPLLSEALAGRRRVFGNDDVNTLTSVHHLGSLYSGSGRLEKAEPYYREAFETSLRTYGEDHPAAMSFQNNMGFLLDKLGRYAEAETMYRQALENRRRVLGEDHPSTLATTINLGALLIQLNKYEESEALLRTALTGNRRRLGDEHPNTLISLNNLGLVIKMQGRFTEAEVFMRESVATNRRTLGSDHAQTLTSINNLAGLLRSQGRMAEAEALYLEALEGDRRVLGDHHPDTLSTMHNLTRLLQTQGKLEEAAELMVLAWRGRQKSLGPEHPDTLRSLDSVGIARFHLGQYEEAESLLRQALEIRSRVLDQGNPEICDSAGNLGMVLKARGAFDEAEPLYRMSLDGYRKALGPDNPRTLVGLSNMGHFHRSRGAFDKAEVFHRQALEGRRRVLGEDNPDVVGSLNALALDKTGAGDYPAAEALWRKSAEIFEKARLRVSTSGLERAFYAERVSPLAPLAACRARNGKPGPAWEAFEENQARGLLDAISARYARPLTSAERDRESTLIGKLSRLDEQLSGLVPDGSAGLTMASLRDDRARLQVELARFENEMVTRYGPAAGEVFDLARIQRALPRDAALVGWIDIAAQPFAADPGGEHWACVVRREGSPQWIRLPGSGDGGAWTEADSQLIDRVRELFGRAPRRSAARRNQALLERLREQRIDPLRPHLDGAGQLIVLPAGAMSGIPIETLESTMTVSYAPSGTMYAWLKEKEASLPSPATAAPPRLLALGDPDFGVPETVPSGAEPPDHGILVAMVMDDSNAYRGGVREGDVLLSYGDERLGSAEDLGPAIRKAAPAELSAVPVTVWRDGETHRLELAPGRMGLMPAREPMPGALIARREIDAALGPVRGRSFDPLPGSRREVEAIAGLFQPEGEQGGNEILLGQAASEERLEALSAAGTLKKFGVIHLATHGVMNDRMALQSALILARGGDSGPGGAATGQAVYDGRLTGEQIVRTWELDADLVTLSGCDTALGRQTGGEGYLGFSQAMFIAGARSLLLSLWKVNDQATMLLMTRFYENLLGRFPRPRSLGERCFEPGQPLTRALALQEAKQWLAGVTVDELRAMGAGMNGPERGETEDSERGAQPTAHRPFADPHFWAAFVLLGDPG